MPDFHCRLSDRSTPLPHFWEHTIGSGHATLALRADWQAQMARCQRELGVRHVRFHGILDDDMGTFSVQMDQPLYSFFNADQIFDFLLSIGMKPFVELSFMPSSLASGKKSVFHYGGNVTPPADPKKWATLIGKLVGHWVERYGVTEVRQWFFEVWNEPNLKAFWSKGQKEYFDLYRVTVQAIKKVDAKLQVGGPATAKNAWVREFVDHCAKKKLPLDFVSTHHYPTDALGNEGDDTITQLAHSRRSILREEAQDTFRRAQGKPVYYTEWNASSNPRDALHDQPYAAAFVTKTILEMNGLVEGYSFWTFSDIFEENYFPSEPFQGGFGLLTIHGLAKPTYRAYQLLHRLGTRRLPVDGLHATVDAWAIPLGKKKLTWLLTNHALPRHSIATEEVHLRVTEPGRPRRVSVERIDEDHANPRRLWEKMKRPNYLSATQLAELTEASQLVAEELPWKSEKAGLEITLKLPPHSVAAVTVEFA